MIWDKSGLGKMTKLFFLLIINVLLIAKKSDGLVYESRVNRICAYDVNRTLDVGLVLSGCFLNDVSYAVAVAVDQEDDLMFYSDIGTLEIRSYNPVTRPAGLGDRILYGFGSVEDMAVDWVAKNLYTADQSFRQIAVSRYDGSHRAVLVQEEVGKPRSIALHPEEGLMFWADYGGLPSIERAGLDGSSRTAIVDVNIQFPNGLAVDFRRNRLFFADRGSDNIASVNLDGSDRQLVHYEFGGDFFDMVLVEEYLFVTSWTSSSIKGYITTIRDVGETNQTVEYRAIEHDRYALGITADDADTQPTISSPCSTNNGGCTQLCFPTANSERTCGCSSGYTASDTSCESTPYEDDFVLVVDSAQQKIFQVPIVTDTGDGDTGLGGDGADNERVRALPLDNLQYPIAVTYDPVDKHVYWTDLTTGSISKAALDGSFIQTIVFDNNVHVGMAIDPERRRIYWTDEDRDVIEVANLDGSGRQVIIQSSLNEPRGIVVDIQTGDIYWTDWGNSPKIEKASSSGTRREILVTENLMFPNGITIDPEARILYWCDSNFPDDSKIEMYDLRTNERTLLSTLPSPSQPYGIAVHGDYVYWSDWAKSAVYRIDRFADDALAEAMGDSVMLGMQGIATSQVFQIVTTLPPAVTAVDGGQSGNYAIPAAFGAGACVVVVIIAVVVGVLCAKRARELKENRRLASGGQGQRSNDYRSRPLPEKCADPPPLPDGHPDGDPLYMDLDAFQREPPPPYTTLNLQTANGAGPSSSSQSHQNPAFESGENAAGPSMIYDMPDGVAPLPPGVNKAQVDAAGGYMPYLKNNAEQEGLYMTPDNPSGTTEAENADSFYEVANA
ncbi:low-density lipoprotein receptor-related protein 6-like [Diadema setosum]|uniref:low-density lipoprotein receptor-related protein 6-like n=1 Tax=Diadema setosum TaxID=31175 RepID=UPI003B3A4FE7